MRQWSVCRPLHIRLCASSPVRRRICRPPLGLRHPLPPSPILDFWSPRRCALKLQGNRSWFIPGAASALQKSSRLGMRRQMLLLRRCFSSAGCSCFSSAGCSCFSSGLPGGRGYFSSGLPGGRDGAFFGGCDRASSGSRDGAPSGGCCNGAPGIPCVA